MLPAEHRSPAFKAYCILFAERVKVKR